jgi:hypothetical protein
MDSLQTVDATLVATESEPQSEVRETETIYPRFIGEVETSNLPLTEEQPYQTFSIPQQRRFKTFEFLQIYLDDWTQPRGYSLRIDSKGKRGKDGQYNSYYLCCTKANNRSSYVSKGQRNKPSHSTNCPFKMTIARDVDTNPSYYYIRNHGSPTSHNHEPSPITTEHANLQRLYIQGREARQKLNKAVEAAKTALDKLIEDEGEQDDWASSSVVARVESRATKNEMCDSALANLDVARTELKQHYEEVKSSAVPKRKKQRLT